jgi:hypothetical protein
MAISTRSSACARAIVSFRRHLYNSVTACGERLLANLVFTEPSLGALAMTTSVRFVNVIKVSPFVRGSMCIAARGISRQPGRAVFSSAQIVARDQAENEPRRSNGASERAADLRFPDPWMIAYRDLDDAETLDGSF